MSNKVDVAVIGAGPYGLSLSAHLAGAKVEHRLFGEPMSAWIDNMPKGMLLKSDPIASNLFDPEQRWTLKRYYESKGRTFAPRGEAVEIETFSDYGQWFQKNAAPHLERKKVVGLDRANGGYRITLDDGETFEANKAVVATGLAHLRYLPPELEGFSPELVSHTEDHVDPGKLRGKKVVVLGGGASAIDLATLMHEAGVDVRLATRRAALEFHEKAKIPRPLLDQVLRPDSDLGPGWRAVFYTRTPETFRLLPRETRKRIVATAFGPSGGWSMRERFEGKVPALYQRFLTKVEEKGGRLALTFRDAAGKTETIEADHLIAATGFKVNLERLPYLSEALRKDIKLENTSPFLSANYETSVPGLYFTGLAAAANFGPVLRFACGAAFPARRISAHMRAG